MTPLPTRVQTVVAVTAALSALHASPAAGTSFVVHAGDTETETKTVTGTDTGTIESGGSLSTSGTAIVWVGPSPFPGIVVTNWGTIRSSTARGIDTSGSSTVRSFRLDNNAGAMLSALDDAFRIDIPVIDGVIVVNNAGVIESINGEAIDFDSVRSFAAGLTINNDPSGVIKSTDSDAIRPGSGGVVRNYGRIIADAAAPNRANDGIGFGNHAGTVNNLGIGSVSGARNGIAGEGGLTLFNEAAASITGRNGDGVRIGGAAVITNRGTIQGERFALDQGGRVEPGTSDGLAIGGGVVENETAALITSADNGILVDDGAGGNAVTAIAISNSGTIEGRDGFAIKIVGLRADTITNRGRISAVGKGAIDMGGGNDTLYLESGSSIAGAIDGGAGVDSVRLSGTGTLPAVAGFERLSADIGSWGLTGTHSYADRVRIVRAAALHLDGATLATSRLEVDEGGLLEFSGAGGVVEGDVNNVGTVQVRGATARFDGAFSNGGAYISEPATQSFRSMVTSERGYIAAGDGDVYRIAGDFLNHSTARAAWMTDTATIEFLGKAGTSHSMLLTGEDRGATPAGFLENFAWGALVIGAGNSLTLDSSRQGRTDPALYVGELTGAVIVGGAIRNISGNGINVYYDAARAANAYLGGRIYGLANGGALIAARPMP